MKCDTMNSRMKMLSCHVSGHRYATAGEVILLYANMNDGATQSDSIQVYFLYLEKMTPKAYSCEPFKPNPVIAALPPVSSVIEKYTDTFTMVNSSNSLLRISLAFFNL